MLKSFSQRFNPQKIPAIRKILDNKHYNMCDSVLLKWLKFNLSRSNSDNKKHVVLSGQ